MAKNRATKPGRILCYIDLSEHSTDLVGYAFEYARLFEAELFVLHSVTDISKAAGFYVPHINTEVLEDEVIKAARDKMYALCHKAVGDEVDAEHRLVTRATGGGDQPADQRERRSICSSCQHECRREPVRVQERSRGAVHERCGDSFMIVPVR